MKTIHLHCASARRATLLLILFLTSLDLLAQVPPAPRPPATSASSPLHYTLPDADAANGSNAGGTNAAAPYHFDFSGVDIKDVLKIYSDLIGRTLLMGAAPSGTIILKTQSNLTKAEAIEALQAVLAMNNVEFVNIGEKFVKVLTPADAGSGGQKLDTFTNANELPDVGGYVTHIVHLNYVKPSSIVPIITPFSKLPNAAVPLDDNGILILRDHAENMKRMLELIAQVDVGGGESQIISEVIPLRYALAEDIQTALNSLGGNGSANVSVGGSTATPTTSGGLARPAGGATGANLGGGTPLRTLGAGGTTGATPNGTPTPGGTTQSRLLTIINNAAAASGGGGKPEPIEIFGQAKIIADKRSNSLLIFATRSDMDAITNVIAKLDVLLSQVLIESLIIDVDLNKAQNLGVSAAQNPKVFTSRDGGIAGGGGSINGPTFINFLAANSTYSNGTNSSTILGNALSSGFSYLGNIGPTWDLAVQAAANDSSATVIQRPRIQTSQAKEAEFKVGQTVPYVTGSTYGSAYGNNTSYSQLFVGVDLDVTPFINPDGLVVMDIKQEIDDLNGSTFIQNVGDVPNTTSRSLNSEIAVRDKDTIMLGGFIRSTKNNTKAGVPYLQDIPIIGNLFSQHSDSKDRQETIVLIRPTVLRSPEIAAEQAVTEQDRLPGIKAALVGDASDERKQVEAEAKAEADATKADAKKMKDAQTDDSGLFQPVPPPSQTIDPGAVQAPNP